MRGRRSTATQTEEGRQHHPEEAGEREGTPQPFWLKFIAL